MAFEVKLLAQAVEELKALRVFDQRRITNEISRQLSHEPLATSRNRKCLHGFAPPFEHEPPVWELRVGEFRVFYDVDPEAGVVFVRAIARKEPGQTTEDLA